MIDLKLTGKKKKKKKRLDDIVITRQSSLNNSSDSNLSQGLDNADNRGDERLVDPCDSESDYKYSYLLSRIHNDNNGKHCNSKALLIAPEVKKEARKSFWTNCKHFSSTIGRDCNHITQFITSELATSGSFDNYGNFIIKGRYDSQKIQSILRQYVITYVICDACKSLQTYLERDASSRLVTLICVNCTSQRTVRRIQNGFIAKV